MKRAKEILWLVPFYVLSLSVSPASAQLSSLICKTQSCVRPTWHFSVQVKMPQVLVDKYGLGA